jgi:hypothetical protein
MGDSDPKPNNPLSPFYPSETPSISGNDRTWVSILLILMFIIFAVVFVFGVLTYL